MWNSGSEGHPVGPRRVRLHPVREADLPSRAIGAGCVCMLSQLGLAGGARGGRGDEDGQVVRPDGHLRLGPVDAVVAGPVLDQSVDVEHLDRQLPARLDHLGPQRGVGDDRLGDDLVDQAGELVEGGAGVGRNGHGTERGERQPAQDVRRGGASRDQDEVTMTDTGIPEPAGESGHLIGGAAEGQGALVGAEPRRPSVSLDRGGQQRGDGLGRGRCHRPSLADRRAPRAKTAEAVKAGLSEVVRGQARRSGACRCCRGRRLARPCPCRGAALRTRRCR